MLKFILRYNKVETIQVNQSIKSYRSDIERKKRRLVDVSYSGRQVFSQINFHLFIC
jgi:hypothetical protein